MKYMVSAFIPDDAVGQPPEWVLGFAHIPVLINRFVCEMPVDAPDLYIGENLITHEDLMTYTFPVNWHASEYKGNKIMVGARNATHHFATHHAGIFLPRGVIPAFLSSVTATQTGPQDFMAKIPISDPDLIFTNPPQS